METPDGVLSRSPERLDRRTRRRKEWQLLRRIAVLFHPYRGRLALVFLLVLVTAALGTVPPLLIQAIFDQVLPRRDLDLLLLYAALLFIVPVVGRLFELVQSELSADISEQSSRSLRAELYRHFQRLPFAFYTTTRGGHIHSAFVNDVMALQGTMVTFAATFVANAATALTTFFVMFYIAPSLTLLSILVLPLVALNTLWLARTRRELSRERQHALANLSALLQDSLSAGGSLLIKTFGRQDHVYEQFARRSDDLLTIERRQRRAGRWRFVLSGAVFALIPALFLAIAGWQMAREIPLLGTSMTAGTLVAFVVLLARFYGPANQLINRHAMLQPSLAQFERVFEILDLPVDIADRPNALPLDPAKLHGDVVFENVSFAYKPDAQLYRRSPGHDRSRDSVLSPTLSHVSFRIEPGQIVALAGRSGAGKTTVAYLLSRLFDPAAGRVLIDGSDIREVSIASLSSCIAVVTQEPLLFHGSIRENLLFGRPDATESELIASAKAAAIHDRICRLPHGYDSLVGERGYKLSGGEKQRIAIARAILKNPRILVLDEATSALDNESEGLVQQALSTLMRGRTTLVIAHRLSTLLAADLILVMETGRIVERGTHSQLMARDGIYYRLYSDQTYANRPSSSRGEV